MQAMRRALAHLGREESFKVLASSMDDGTWSRTSIPMPCLKALFTILLESSEKRNIPRFGSEALA